MVENKVKHIWLMLRYKTRLMRLCSVWSRVEVKNSVLLEVDRGAYITGACFIMIWI